MRFRFVIEVDNGRESFEGGPYTATAAGLEAKGDTPSLALAALARVLDDWAEGGSDRYLSQGGMLKS